MGAAWRDLIHLELAQGEAGAATDATEFGPVAMDLCYLPAACLLVQVVDVLGDDVLEESHFFHFRHGIMGRVGFGVLKHSEELRHIIFLVRGAGGPPGGRVGHELLIAIHRWLSELCPDPAGAAEGRDAALDGDAGAYQGNGVARSGDYPRCSFQCLVVDHDIPCRFAPLILSVGFWTPTVGRDYAQPLLAPAPIARGPTGQLKP